MSDCPDCVKIKPSQSCESTTHPHNLSRVVLHHIWTVISPEEWDVLSPSLPVLWVRVWVCMCERGLKMVWVSGCSWISQQAYVCFSPLLYHFNESVARMFFFSVTRCTATGHTLFHLFSLPSVCLSVQSRTVSHRKPGHDAAWIFDPFGRRKLCPFKRSYFCRITPTDLISTYDDVHCY